MRARAVGSSKEGRGTLRECSRAGQYRLSCTGQFFKIPAKLRTCCRCSRKKLARTSRARQLVGASAYWGRPPVPDPNSYEAGSPFVNHVLAGSGDPRQPVLSELPTFPEALVPRPGLLPVCRWLDGRARIITELAPQSPSPRNKTKMTLRAKTAGRRRQFFLSGRNFRGLFRQKRHSLASRLAWMRRPGEAGSATEHLDRQRFTYSGKPRATRLACHRQSR